MTQTVDTSADSDRAAEIRNALTDKLRSDGMITSSVVERVFRTVPRHLLAAERKAGSPSASCAVAPCDSYQGAVGRAGGPHHLREITDDESRREHSPRHERQHYRQGRVG